jgi:transaldolase
MSHQGYFNRVTAQTPTRLWVNNVTVAQAKTSIEVGAVGCTQNPSYTWKMLQEDAENTLPLLDALLETSLSDDEIQINLQRQLVTRIANEFAPLYKSSGGTQGYVTIQGNPFLETADEIVRQGLLTAKVGPNLMAKVPVIPEGLVAIEKLASQGVPLCCTEVMGVRQAIDAAESYVRGIRGLDHPAPCYIAHIAGIYDEYLGKQVEAEGIDIAPDILWHAGVAIAKKVSSILRERRYPVEFLTGGARGLHHFTEIVGAHGAVTINWAGCGDILEEQNPVVVQRFLSHTPESVLDELCLKLPDFCRGYKITGLDPDQYEAFGPVALFRSSFEQAWSKALDFIAQRRTHR